MTVSKQLTRFAEYYRRHGLLATFRRLDLAARQALFSSRSVLFYCDLTALPPGPAELPHFLKIERKRCETEIGAEDFTIITSVWNPKLARRNVKERFDKGASLWLIRSSGSLAGYGWTLRGKTIEPHYFPLGPGDVHLFDFFVLPRHRSKGINPTLVGSILDLLSAECTGRAFIEAAEWNAPQLASLQKTPFRRLGSARKFSTSGPTFVIWSEKHGVSGSTPILQAQNSRPDAVAAEPVPLVRQRVFSVDGEAPLRQANLGGMGANPGDPAPRGTLNRAERDGKAMVH